MTSPIGVVNQQIATTRAEWKDNAVIDQVLKNKPALATLRGKAKSGSGRGIEVPLFAGSAQTAMLGPGATFDTSKSADVITTAYFDWAKNGVGTPLRLDWMQLEQNKGNKTKLIDIALKTAHRAVEDHSVYLDQLIHGTSADQTALGIYGLDQLIGIDTLAGVNPATPGNEFWKSTVTELGRAAEPSVRVALRRHLAAQSKACGASTKPDLALVGENVYDEYVDSLDEAVRIQAGAKPQDIDTEFEEIRHGGLTLRLDTEMDKDTAYTIHTPDLMFEYLNDNFLKEYTGLAITGSLEQMQLWVTLPALAVGARNKHGRFVRGA